MLVTITFKTRPIAREPGLRAPRSPEAQHTPHNMTPEEGGVRCTPERCSSPSLLVISAVGTQPTRPEVESLTVRDVSLHLMALFSVHLAVSRYTGVRQLLLGYILATVSRSTLETSVQAYSTYTQPASPRQRQLKVSSACYLFLFPLSVYMCDCSAGGVLRQSLTYT